MKKFKGFLIDAVTVIIGSVIYAVALVCLLAPNGIAPGGISGLSTIINSQLPFLSIGLLTVIFNIPIIIIGFIYLGRKFIIKTLISTLAVSATTYLLEMLPMVPTYTDNKLLASIFGGILFGIGIGIIFTRGFTTGGSDVLVRVLKKFKPYLSIGTLTMSLDFVVVVLAGVVYGSVEHSFYAIIAIFFSSKLMDVILNGLDSARMVYIVSDKSEEIARYISNEIDRGITFLHGKGYYSGKEREVILVALRPQQLYSVRNIIKNVDPAAFMIFTNASEVLGEGFKTDLDK